MFPRRGSALAVLSGLSAVLAAALVASVAVGAVTLPLGEVAQALVGDGDPAAREIVRVLRLPRAALAALVGGALGMAGAALQGVTRNPLAEPYLLGVSGGAAVGAVLASSLGGAAVGVPVGALVGAIAAVALALVIARGAGVAGDARVLLMAGVVVGALANAVIMIALAHAPPSTVRGALWWMMGSVADADWAGVRLLATAAVVGGGALLVLAREIDVLALGDDAAAALGVDVTVATRRVFLLAAVVAAATVAAAGLVGFVGLVVPYLARALGLRGHRAVLTGSALAGGALVVAADVAARVAAPPAELPLGAITALVGVPFFLGRLRSMR